MTRRFFVDPSSGSSVVVVGVTKTGSLVGAKKAEDYADEEEEDQQRRKKEEVEVGAFQNQIFSLSLSLALSNFLPS